MLDIVLQKHIIGPIAIILTFSLTYIIISKIIKKMVKSNDKRIDKRKKTLIGLFTNLIKYFFLIIAILMILSIYGIDTTALVTSLGVIGVMAGLALQDTLKDLLSGVTIITENQYAVGDIVTIGGFKGEVLSLGIKTTKIKSLEGEVKFIANRNITEVINHSLSNSLAVVNILIDNSQNIDLIENKLNELFDKIKESTPYIKGKIQLLGVEEVNLATTTLKVIAETTSLKHHEVERMLRKAIKKELDMLKQGDK